MRILRGIVLFGLIMLINAEDLSIGREARSWDFPVCNMATWCRNYASQVAAIYNRGCIGLSVPSLPAPIRGCPFVDPSYFVNRRCARDLSDHAEGRNWMKSSLQSLFGFRSIVVRYDFRTILYRFTSGFDTNLGTRVITLLNQLETVTCLRFQQSISRTLPNPFYLLSFYPAPGSTCLTRLPPSTSTGSQTAQVYLSPQCTSGTILHELFHALGLEHEHARVDRDTFVDIIWQNIEPSSWIQFCIKPGYNGYGPYGYNSIMHYAGNAHSINGSRTIVMRRNPGPRTLGQRVGLTECDICKIIKKFQCPTASTCNNNCKGNIVLMVNNTVQI